MKKKAYSIFIISFFCVHFSFLFSSCSEDEVPAGIIPSTEYFKIVGDTVVMEGTATEASFTITADCPWTITTNGWDDLHVTPDRGEGGQTIKITTTTNDTPTQRRGTMTITTGEGIAKTMTILQNAGNIVLEVTPETLKFGINGGSQTVTVTSNTSWKVSGGADWCRADKNSGTGNGDINITVDKSDEKEPREATFSITPAGSTRSVSVKVTQSNKDITLILSPESMTFDATTQQQKELDVICNDTWAASVSTDWLRISQKKGTGDATINVSCENNNTGAERTANVTVTCNGITKTCSVTQRNFNVKFEIIPTTLSDIPAAGAEQAITVVSNTAWTVSGVPGWCHLSPTEGNGNANVTIMIDANEQTEPRTASLTFLPTDAEPVVLAITQKGKENKVIVLNVSPTELSFGADEESKTITVECNDTWTASVDKDWVTFNTEEQTASGELTKSTVKVTCTANTTGTARVATLTVMAGSEQRTVNITQGVAGAPVVFDLAVTDTIDGKATLTARYSSTLAVTEYGFVYATHPAPSLDDTKVTFYGNNTVGNMTANLSGLTVGTTYHVRAYAVSAVGTGYSDELHFNGQGRQPEQGDNGTPTLSRRRKSK